MYMWEGMHVCDLEGFCSLVLSVGWYSNAAIHILYSLYFFYLYNVKWHTESYDSAGLWDF